jgi:hypothetical protein
MVGLEVDIASEAIAFAGQRADQPLLGAAIRDFDGGVLTYRAAPVLNATMTVKTSQPGVSNFANGQRGSAIARGGVIARVCSSMRQKSKRPLKFIWGADNNPIAER